MWQNKSKPILSEKKTTNNYNQYHASVIIIIITEWFSDHLVNDQKDWFIRTKTLETTN